MSTELVRTPDVIAGEINQIKTETFRFLDAAYSYATRSSYDIGKLLCEAKEIVAENGWCDWLRDNVDYSADTAQNLMRIYREYDIENVETFRKLSYSQMVAMFPLPPGERKQFAEECSAPDKSVRELKKLVEEKKKTDAYVKQLENQKNKLESDYNAKVLAVNDLNKKLKDYNSFEAENKKLQKKITDLENAPPKVEVQTVIKNEPTPEKIIELEKKIRAELEEKYKSNVDRNDIMKDPKAVEINLLFGILQESVLDLSLKLKIFVNENPDVGSRFENLIGNNLKKLLQENFRMEVETEA